MFNSNSAISSKLIFLWFLLVSTTVLASELVQRVDISEREKAAQEVTQQFVKQLGGHLKKEMAASGPAGAIKVCRDVAPEIASELSLKNGWRVTRVSAKPRNSLMGTPDQWESETMVEFELRAEKGEQFANMANAEVVTESGKTYFRYMKPLAVQPICLSCHGDEKQLSPDVKTKLSTMYPHDKAIGYKAGDLRGAVSIKQPIDTAIVHNQK